MMTRRDLRIGAASVALGFAGVMLGIVTSIGQSPVASPEASAPATSASAAAATACPSPSAAVLPAPTAAAVGSTAAPSLPAASPVAAPAPTQTCRASRASPGASPTTAATTVTIRDFEFAPPSITVPAGSTVMWSNEGPSGHTVTADDGSFDSRTITPGATFEMTFDTPGTYAYHCTPHPNMVGTVVVQ